MKDWFEKIHKDEIRIESEQKKTVIVGRLGIHPGHKLFSFDKETLEVVQVDYKNSHVDPEGNVRRSVDYDSTKIYFTALNLKNARRKVLKRFFS